MHHHQIGIFHEIIIMIFGKYLRLKKFILINLFLFKDLKHQNQLTTNNNQINPRLKSLRKYLFFLNHFFLLKESFIDPHRQRQILQIQLLFQIKQQQQQYLNKII